MSSDRHSRAACHADGDALRLRCERCARATQVEVSDPPRSRVYACKHCGGPLYWHHCERCGLSYAGDAQPHCAVCDGDDEELTFS